METAVRPREQLEGRRGRPGCPVEAWEQVSSRQDSYQCLLNPIFGSYSWARTDPAAERRRRGISA